MEEQRNHLLGIIHSYSNWLEKEHKNKQEEARESLNMLFHELNDIEPCKEYRDGGGGIHTTYVFNLLQLRQALELEDYVNACGELYNMMIRTPFFQPRIVYNVIELLGKYLNVGEKDVYKT